MYDVGKCSTQREWITPPAAPLQRSNGVVAVSKKYQNLKKIGDDYVTAAMPELILGLEMAKWKTFMNILQMVILLHIKAQIQKINQQK